MNNIEFNETPLLSLYEKNIIDLVEDIWKTSKYPCSVYLRGSYANLKRKHTPWDLDVYFVVQNYKGVADNVENISEVLNSEYPELPKLDLTIISKYDLSNLEENILKRLLLIHGGVLAKGTPLKKIVVNPPLDNETANKVKAIMHGFVSPKIHEVRQDNCGLLKDLNFRLKKISKMLIRTGVFIGIEKNGIFSRDINYCYDNLIEKYPQLKHDVDYMYKTLQGNYIEYSYFIASADRIKNTVYYEEKFNK